MKLLLTSSWITNKSIERALFSLINKRSEELTVVYIPTASNIITWDKGWAIDSLIKLKGLNFKSIEITDISAVDSAIWKQSIENADIIFFEWWDTYYLIEWLNKSGLTKLMKKLLEDKVYVGVSAWSMVANKNLNLCMSKDIYWDWANDYELKWLELVDFLIFPHLNSDLDYFKNRKKDFIEYAFRDVKDKIYVLDDDSAVLVVDDKVEVVSEGEYFVINE